MGNGANRDRVDALRAILKHDFFVYDEDLTFLWSPANEDVLQRLRRSRTYLVDNNVSWKSLAQAHPDVTFVIGCTILEEANDLQGVLFSRMPAGGYANAFLVALTAMEGVRIVFNRLEERYQAAAFSGAIPTLKKTPAEHRSFQLRAAAALRTQLLLNLPRPAEDLQRELETHAALGRNSYENSAMAAMLATTLMVQRLGAARRRTKLDPSYVQLPGDTRLIAESLFYGFPILSNDVRDVHALGGIVGVSVTTEVDFKQASGGRVPTTVPAS